MNAKLSVKITIGLVVVGLAGIPAWGVIKVTVEDTPTQETLGRIALSQKSIKSERVEQGVDFWVWVEKLIWKADERPLFNADLSHRGKRELPRLGPYELKLDSAWYVESLDEESRSRDFDPHVFRPQHDYHDIRFALDSRWQSKQSGNPLRITPGRHRIGLAFHTDAPDPAADEPIRITTNVVEFRILGPGEEITEEEWFTLAVGGRPGSRFSAKDVRSYHRMRTGKDLSHDELKKIYTDIALRESQTGGDPYVLTEIVERALAFRQDDLTRLRLYTILGGAYWGQKKKYAPKLVRRYRRVAVEAYLTGLRDVLDHDLPVEKPEQRGVYTGAVLHEFPEMVEKLRNIYALRVAARKNPKRIRELVDHRQVLTGQIIQIYAREPDAFEELHQLVLKRIGSEEAADKMVKAAKAYRNNQKSKIPVIESMAREEPAGREVSEFMAAYNVNGLTVEAGFIPDESQIILGQPLFVTFTVINHSAKPYGFNVGGDSRGSVRHNNFHITAVDREGQAVKDPYSYNHHGGHGGEITLKGGQAYTERLYLGHWCAFEKPGVYTVTSKRTLEDYGQEPRHPKVSVTASFKLKILPPNRKKMREVIVNLGKELPEGEQQAIYEAALGLAEINDEQTIPHLALSLTKGDYQNKKHAVRGLSRFSSNAAADALLVALKDPDYAVRGAAGEALRKIKKVERALKPLLRQLRHESASIRALAARALGATRAKPGLLPLIRTMDDPQAIVRHAAAVALGFLGSKEAIQPLRQHLEDKDMGMRVAAVKGLRKLGEPLQVEWLTPVIRATTDLNDQNFHEAIRLIRLSGEEKAARALVSCLKFDDPSPRNSYNMFLILAIEHCPGGPKYYYKFYSNPNTDGTPEQIENNRRILRALKTWLKEQHLLSGHQAILTQDLLYVPLPGREEHVQYTLREDCQGKALPVTSGCTRNLTKSQNML